MTIDPRVGLYLSIVMAILAYLTGATAVFTDLFGAQHAKIIMGLITLVLGILSSINAVLHAIPSKPGAAAEFPLGPKV
jgi:hypothetical protein